LPQFDVPSADLAETSGFYAFRMLDEPAGGLIPHNIQVEASFLKLSLFFRVSVSMTEPSNGV
jgi:hypothetical protein